MDTQWKQWLAAERAAERTGLVCSWWPIVRGQAYSLPLPIPGDVSTGNFAAALFVGPDAGLAPLATFDVEIGAFDAEAGTTLVTLSLGAGDTDGSLPADLDFDGLTEVVFKMDYTPAGGVAVRALGLVIPVVE